ncbi:MAG: hypothetical protein ABI600_14340 [Luteolibacter sp.]
MNSTAIRKSIGGVAVLLGLLLFGGLVIFPAIKAISDENEGFSGMFLVITLPLMATPGILLTYFGVSLFRRMSEESLRAVIGTIAVLGVFFISSRLSLAFPGLVPKRIEPPLGVFLGTWVMVPLYLLVMRSLLPALGAECKSMRELLSRGVLNLMAWVLWTLLSSITFECIPINSDYSFPGMVLSFIVPYFIYRIAAARLLPAKVDRGKCPVPLQ